MTNISANSMLSAQSPRAMMDARISAATQAGSISTADQQALETALDSIDSALGAGGGAKPASRLDPSEMKTRIDDLIQQQVSAGTLTDDQASELKDFFAQGPGGADGAGGGKAMTGPGGMPPMGPPPGGGASDGSSDDSTDASDATKQLDSLISFLEKLRESISASNGYGTNGSTDNSSGLLIDQLA